jgi:hypothetical protein
MAASSLFTKPHQGSWQRQAARETPKETYKHKRPPRDTRALLHHFYHALIFYTPHVYPLLSTAMAFVPYGLYWEFLVRVRVLQGTGIWNPPACWGLCACADWAHLSIS